MNIVSLQTFLEIVETGSLVRASQKLNVTQSTVTARLKALEEEMGQVLLIRQKSGATLTPAGSKLLRYARIMTGLWRQAKFETGLPAGSAGSASFGFNRELWHGPGRTLFHGLKSRHPDIALSIQQGNSQELENWLQEGIVDATLTYEAVARGNHTVLPLPPQELILYSNRPDTPVVGDQEYVFVDYGAEFRRMHAESYHNAGISRVNFDASERALDYITTFGGTAYLPKALGDAQCDAGLIYPVRYAPVYSLKICLVVNDTAAQSWNWLAELVSELDAQALSKAT